MVTVTIKGPQGSGKSYTAEALIYGLTTRFAVDYIEKETVINIPYLVRIDRKFYPLTTCVVETEDTIIIKPDPDGVAFLKSKFPGFKKMIKDEVKRYIKYLHSWQTDGEKFVYYILEVQSK